MTSDEGGDDEGDDEVRGSGERSKKMKKGVKVLSTKRSLIMMLSILYLERGRGLISS